MSKTHPIASKWNARYAYANQSHPLPGQVLVNGKAYIPSTGLALDFACGRGGNAFYLAANGLSVQAWDVSSTAIDCVVKHQQTLSQPVQIKACVRDVVELPPEPETFDVIVVTRFLDRSLCASISAALKSNGVLFYQTFTAGLSNPDYLLQPNELPTLFPDLHPLYSMESEVDEKGYSEAFFIAQKILVEH